ncbi:MAG: hypothetical protein MUC50_18450 [Myxococcota bacterium]|jgi:hypothetical protein|nr:hypothetical protein [Myxococcota bacterium]
MKGLLVALLMGGLSIGAVFSASSCGDDDTTNGVSNSKKLSELSEEEAYDLCFGFCQDVRVPRCRKGSVPSLVWPLACSSPTNANQPSMSAWKHPWIARTSAT